MPREQKDRFGRFSAEVGDRLVFESGLSGSFCSIVRLGWGTRVEGTERGIHPRSAKRVKILSGQFEGQEANLFVKKVPGGVLPMFTIKDGAAEYDVFKQNATLMEVLTLRELNSDPVMANDFGLVYSAPLAR